METNKNQTNEKKSFKEVLVENKGIFIVGGLAAMGAVVGGTFMLKQLKIDSLLMKLAYMQVEINDTASEALKDLNEELIAVKTMIH